VEEDLLAEESLVSILDLSFYLLQLTAGTFSPNSTTGQLALTKQLKYANSLV